MVLPIFSSKVHKTGHILERQRMRARYILVNLWQFEDDLPSETASTFTVLQCENPLKNSKRALHAGATRSNCLK